MQNRSMISEISARLLSSGVFQFIGLSHNGFELENKMGQISSSDIIIVEDCFSGDELHEIVRFINGKAASVLGARRIFKALIYPRGARVPDIVELTELGFDMAISLAYSNQYIINRINMLIYSNTCFVLDHWVSQIIQEGIEIPNFNETLTNLLHEIGIASSLLGSIFLKRAIEIAFINLQSVTLGITKVIYPTVAIMYKTTPTKVERAIRFAIDTSWQRGDVDVINQIFSYSYSVERGKPTNGEFVANIADYLILKFRAERKLFLYEHYEQVEKINALIDISTSEIAAGEKNLVEFAMDNNKKKIKL